MSQFFAETAHNKTDLKKYQDGWERVFGKKEEPHEPDCSIVINARHGCDCGASERNKIKEEGEGL